MDAFGALMDGCCEIIGLEDKVVLASLFTNSSFQSGIGRTGVR